MILYDTIVGLAAAVARVLVAALFEKWVRPVLGITISVRWPCKKVLHANIRMGERALAFGVLLAARLVR